MTRTRSALSDRLSRLDLRWPDGTEGRTPAAFPAALAVGALAAVLLVAGSVMPVVSGASPGFASAPLLIVLAVAPMALTAVFVLRGRPATAAGVLAGAAVLAPGRLVVDLQFFADPSATARPELYRPVVFALPPAAPGLWLLLAGLAATVTAGGLAVHAVGSRAGSRAEGRAGGRGRLACGLGGAAIAGIGVMMAPFSSSDAFLPVGSAFESPTLVLAGCLLMAFALPVAAGLAITSGTAELVRGSLLGLGLGAVTVALPDLVSGLAVPGVTLAAGPIVMLAGAAGLVPAAFLAGERTAGFPAEKVTETAEAGEARLPGSARLRATTGTLGLLTMLTALVGALTPQVVVAGGVAPQSPSRWLLFAAGLLVGALSLAMFVPRLAANVRPALSVCWAGVALAATAVLTTAITASELGFGLGPGPGAPWVAVSVLLAAATACCSVVAGMVERDDGDDPVDHISGPALFVPLVAGGVLAIGAFGAPSIVSPGYSEPALWSDFGTPSWGLLIALLTVLGASLLALRSRPPRAAALLVGAAGVAVVRLLALPLAIGEIPGAHAGLGWWLTLGCVVALVVAAMTAVTGGTARRTR
jgi:hypothetical protein